jgi:hypothetical protein
MADRKKTKAKCLPVLASPLSGTGTAEREGTAMEPTPTVTNIAHNWPDSQSCGCWPSKGIVCWAHSGCVTGYQASKAPHRCPVCEGKGNVPNGFYSAIGVEVWSSSSIMPEACRSCDGTGVVWG